MFELVISLFSRLFVFNFELLSFNTLDSLVTSVLISPIANLGIKVETISITKSIFKILPKYFLFFILITSPYIFISLSYLEISVSFSTYLNINLLAAMD